MHKHLVLNLKWPETFQDTESLFLYPCKWFETQRRRNQAGQRQAPLSGEPGIRCNHTVWCCKQDSKADKRDPFWESWARSKSPLAWSAKPCHKGALLQEQCCKSGCTVPARLVILSSPMERDNCILQRCNCCKLFTEWSFWGSWKVCCQEIGGERSSSSSVMSGLM